METVEKTKSLKKGIFKNSLSRRRKFENAENSEHMPFQIFRQAKGKLDNIEHLLVLALSMQVVEHSNLFQLFNLRNFPACTIPNIIFSILSRFSFCPKGKIEKLKLLKMLVFN